MKTKQKIFSSNNQKNFKKGIDKALEVWYYIGVAARKFDRYKKTLKKVKKLSKKVLTRQARCDIIVGSAENGRRNGL